MPQDDQPVVLMFFIMLAAILAVLGLMVGASKLIRWRRANGSVIAHLIRLAFAQLGSLVRRVIVPPAPSFVGGSPPPTPTDHRRVPREKSIAPPPVAPAPAPAITLEALPILGLPALASMLQEIPHVAIIGNTNAGKTTLAEALIRLLDGQFAIVDPKWRLFDPPKWGGLPAAKLDVEGAYSEIATFFGDLWTDFRKRRIRGQTEANAIYTPLWIVWDEINDTIEELQNAGVYLRRWARVGREYGYKLMIFPQSDRVGALGLEGHGDVRDQFCWIYLGDDARSQIEKLRKVGTISTAQALDLSNQAYPSIMEHAGKWFGIDRSAALELLGMPLNPDRAWVAPAVPVPDDSAEVLDAPAAPAAGEPSIVQVAAIRWWLTNEPTIQASEIVRRLGVNKKNGLRWVREIDSY
ncbi:type IV secretory system conjugative DNA transfer family protein [Herpetosiphon geysericola]|uniref:Uncharacterized protein n=1 Tax=Herpetosiphon geysericola TaxID=70996 RepID=A0A0P6YZW5_9CHLR|nr:type IV secretory system conjugative DNA transfer family protein [Herpetosiphon geysericola]KPL90753.1 hypothetical protein SE18_05140 [Herpetosiphon geysericola]